MTSTIVHNYRIEIGAIELRCTHEARNLLEHAERVAKTMRHSIVDPAHVIVAALELPEVYYIVHKALWHPSNVHTGELYWQTGLGLEYQQVKAAIQAVFPVTVEVQSERYPTAAMRYALTRAANLANEAYERRDRVGESKISLTDIVWACIESGSVPLSQIIPDKYRAMHEFFAPYHQPVPQSVVATVTSALPTVGL